MGLAGFPVVGPAATGALLFPGQGAQQLGMGLDLCEAEPAARQVFEVAAQVLGFDLRDILAGQDAAALDRTDVCQPAILATSLAALRAVAARGLLREERIGACAGLSLGEYSALTWAGALQLEDALRLVRTRGQAMQRASEERQSGMLSLVGATQEAAAALCQAARGDGVLVVANLLAPGQVAIAGTQDALARAQALLGSHGIRKAVPLPVAGAFHSPCMQSASDALARALEGTSIRQPRVPVVMNVSAQPTTDPGLIRDQLRRQITSPVLWQQSMEGLLARGIRQFFEPAPQRQLGNMLRRYEPAPLATGCAKASDLDALTPWPQDPPPGS